MKTAVFCLPVVVLTVTFSCCQLVLSVNVDTCTGYDFHASCEANEIILMEAAEFGRMGPGACISVDRGNFGCRNDVLFLVDRWCSGRNQCRFNVPNVDMMEANTECVEVLAFLRASYTCLAMSTVVLETCSSSSPNVVSNAEGLISSHVTRQTGCGSWRSPWILEAKTGQTLELSLVDFGALDRARARSRLACPEIYGFVAERTLNINQTICGQNVREDVIYRSKTNAVEVYLKRNNNANFLIKYKVSGCSDPVAGLHTWYKRNGVEAVMGCKNGDRQWRLTCVGQTWQGKTGHCAPTVMTSIREKQSTERGNFDLSTVVIVSGIIGGTVVLAVAVIVCGVVCIHKYRNKMEKNFNEQQLRAQNETLTKNAALRRKSSETTENQDDYLQPNVTNTSHPRTTCTQPLIHIWQTELPKPVTDHTAWRQSQRTIHAKSSTHTDTVTANGPDKACSTASYYSPNTGHKYCVLDRDK